MSLFDRGRSMVDRLAAHWRLRALLPMALAMITGCATEQNQRELERSHPAADSASAGLPTSEISTANMAPPVETNSERSHLMPIDPVWFAAGTSEVESGQTMLLQGTPELKSDPVTASPVVTESPDFDPGVRLAAEEAPLLVPSPNVIPPPTGTYPIDLTTALRLADVSNPTIGAARTMILEALALQLSARTLLVPSLNGGASYHGHNGVLQRSAGNILNVSLQSLYVGGGAVTSVAGTVGIPAVSILTPITDAWFEPLVARQRLASARFGAQATSYEILVDVALLHLQLLGNQSILELQRKSEADFYEVYRLTKNYAEAGEGRQADANRARSQWKRRRALVQKAEEGLAVTAAQLANRLNLDPSVRLEPIGGPLVPLTLVPVDAPQRELIQVALERRPDIAARTAAIGQAEARWKEEIGRPLLPTLWLGFSGGAFGGGSNLSPPTVGNFAGRTDFDVDVYWTLMNMGTGNIALIKQRRAEIGQAVAEQSRTINRARDEVSSALAEARAAQNEIDIARGQLHASELSYKEDLDRTKFRGAEKPRDVLPIELLNSLDLLATARVNLIRALVRYDQSQYRLWVSLGSPPPLASD